MPSGSIIRKDAEARDAYESLTGKSAHVGRSIFTSPSDEKKRYPFTVRLPVTMYANLRDKADRERRSVAAQIELDLEKIYA